MLSSTHLIAENEGSRKLKGRLVIQEEVGAGGCCFLGGTGAKKPKKKKKSKPQVDRESHKSLNLSNMSINDCKHTGKEGEVCAEC